MGWILQSVLPVWMVVDPESEEDEVGGQLEDSVSQMNIGTPNLTDVEKQITRKIVMEHKYVFAIEGKQLRSLEDVEHRLEMTTCVGETVQDQPKISRNYR